MKMEREEFNKAIEEWKGHCEKTINSSNPNDYLNCDAYRKIVSMGREVLPLVRSVYDSNSSSDFGLDCVKNYLTFVVRKIVGGDFKVPDGIYLGMRELEDYTKRWLDENMEKYLRK